MHVNEENIAREAGTGIAFIPWCNGQVIRGHGKGVLVKFDGFRPMLTTHLFFLLANYCFFLFAFFLGAYSERNFIHFLVNSFGLRV